MVALAPHLVRPLPLVVPAFDGARPDRLVGVGLNLYDVMSVDRDVCARAARAAPRPSARPPASRAARRRGATESWSPERHRVISGEEVLELLPALAAREPTSGYLFYDCQTDDARLVLTVLGEAERFGAVLREPPRRDRAARARRARAAACRCATSRAARAFEVRAANVVNATGVWADQLRPQELARRGRAAAASARAAARTSRSRHERPAAASAARSCPAGSGRSIFALPWLGHTLIGTTDNDYEGPLEHVEPSARGHRLPARRGQRLLRHGARPRAS